MQQILIESKVIQSWNIKGIWRRVMRRFWREKNDGGSVIILFQFETLIKWESSSHLLWLGRSVFTPNPLNHSQQDFWRKLPPKDPSSQFLFHCSPYVKFFWLMGSMCVVSKATFFLYKNIHWILKLVHLKN